MRGSLFVLISGIALFAVSAGNIKVLTPASLTSPATLFATAFGKEAGARIVVGGGNRPNILAALKAHDAGDVVLLPAADMEALAASLRPASRTKLVRIPVGVAVRAGSPHPDISTPDKFLSVALAASSIAFTDPAAGSSAGATVAAMFRRPEFAGVKLRPVMALATTAVAEGNAEMGLQMVTEIPGVSGVELVGPVPAYFDAYVDFDAAVPVSSAAPAEALGFIRYMTRPEAATIWKAIGLQAR